jgi:hypothetical protein
MATLGPGVLKIHWVFANNFSVCAENVSVFDKNVSVFAENVTVFDVNVYCNKNNKATNKPLELYGHADKN